MNEEVNFKDYEEEKQQEYLKIKDKVVGENKVKIEDIVDSFYKAYFDNDTEKLINLLNSTPKNEMNLAIEKLNEEIPKVILVLYEDMDYNIKNIYDEEINETLKTLISLDEYIYAINIASSKSDIINYIGPSSDTYFTEIKYDSMKSVQVDSLNEHAHYYDYISEKVVDKEEFLEQDVRNEYYYLLEVLTILSQSNNNYEFDFTSMIIIYEYEKIKGNEEDEEKFLLYI